MTTIHESEVIKAVNEFLNDDFNFEDISVGMYATGRLSQYTIDLINNDIEGFNVVSWSDYELTIECEGVHVTCALVEGEWKIVNKDHIVTIDFKNVVSEMESKKLKVLIAKSKKRIFIQNEQGNFYQMEVAKECSYLDRLITNGDVVKFYQIDSFANKIIEAWEKEVWDFSEVESFIKRHKL